MPGLESLAGHYGLGGILWLRGEECEGMNERRVTNGWPSFALHTLWHQAGWLAAADAPSPQRTDSSISSMLSSAASAAVELEAIEGAEIYAWNVVRCEVHGAELATGRAVHLTRAGTM